MRSPFDTLAKALIGGCLAPVCSVETEAEATMEPLYADAVVDPLADEAAMLQRGLLGRMARERCVIEAFAQTASVEDVDRCMGRASMLRATQKANRVLWVISAGRSSAAITSWKLRRSREWGAGVYASRIERAPRLVVVAELPRTRHTLLLRLMGREQVLSSALREAQALPIGAWEREFVWRALLRVRDDLARMTGSESTHEEETMRYQEIAEWADKMLESARSQGEALGRAQGEALGRAQGEAEALRAVIAARGFVLDAATDERIRSCSDGAVLRAWIVRAVSAPSLSAVFEER